MDIETHKRTQAVLFDLNKYTIEEAYKWIEDNDLRVQKPLFSIREYIHNSTSEYLASYRRSKQNYDKYRYERVKYNDGISLVLQYDKFDDTHIPLLPDMH